MDEEDMDALELMAWDLEVAQNKRYNAAKEIPDREFWRSVNEQAVRQTIATLRKGSSTYHPDNYRKNYR